MEAIMRGLKNKGAVDVVILVVVGLVAIFGFTYSKITKKDDTPVEESSEAIIKDVTGYDIDLTPGSPEAAKAAAIQKAGD